MLNSRKNNKDIAVNVLQSDTKVREEERLSTFRIWSMKNYVNKDNGDKTLEYHNYEEWVALRLKRPLKKV
jgi:hypothetical protein